MKTNREKILVFFLPALLVLVVYVNWFNSPLQADIARAAKEASDLRAKSNPALLATKAARVGQLTEELKQLQAHRRELEQQWQALTGTEGESPRSERIEQLTALLKRHGLHVVEQAQADGGKDATIPPALAELAKRMATGDEKHKPQLWRFRVQGSYAAVLRVLAQLTYGEPAVTPLAVTMKEIKDAGLSSTQRDWTLLVWI